MNNPTQLRRLILGLYRRVAGAALALAIALVLAVVVTGSAQAQTYSVLYSFTGGADGGYPLASLVPDTKGNLYGTTSERGAYGAGTVFKVATNRQLIVLYSFTGGADGANPYGGLVQDPQGNLYGTTNGGGAYGVGTVFKLDTNGNETVLHSFSNGPDGASPQAGLVLDTQGNLFGTTTGGGAKDWGTVFKLDPTGNETVLHSFASFDGDGSLPSSGLVMDAQGNLYGTTVEGGTHVYGTVYKIDQTGNETVLHSFTGGKPDGESPDGGVVLDSQGNLYGTTFTAGPLNRGTVFAMDPSGNETLLCDFLFLKGGTHPEAGVVLDAQGNLYGATDANGSGAGTIFQLSGYSYTVLHIFNLKKRDGGYPQANLVLDAQGNLYGTTPWGGDDGFGTVFALLSSAAATTTVLTSAPNPSTHGQAVTFTAVVSGPAGVPPDGETVSFTKGKKVLGTATLSGGSANFTISTLKNGTTTVTAVYSGDVLFAGSTSNVVKQVVTK